MFRGTETGKFLRAYDKNPRVIKLEAVSFTLRKREFTIRLSMLKPRVRNSQAVAKQLTLQ